MKFFGGIWCEEDGCYLSVVLRHAGAFGNKLVRDGERLKAKDRSLRKLLHWDVVHPAGAA